MPSPREVSLVVTKVRKAYETGDQCNAMACGKSVPEWKEIFNEASAALKMPIIEVGPLQGGTMKDAVRHVESIVEAFERSAGNPAIILSDATGNRLQTNPDLNMQISNYIEGLTKEFPNALYVQVVPEISMGPQPFVVYCHNPKTPRDPSAPIYPI